MEEINRVLQDVFWFDSFREWQENIINSVVSGENTLVFMPTWWGKSLTYQVPGLVRKGLCIVISPLISLMKDQVDTLRDLWVNAALINSTISFWEQQNILNEISKNNDSIKFLYIAPERLNSANFLRVLQNIDISLIAIDEAHCISQWGHDFRPSYMKVKGFIEKLWAGSSFPIMALTATATQKVKTDIIARLWLESYKMFTAGFDRKNLILVVREISKKDEKLEKTFEILSKTPWSGIIYCSSRKAVDEVYDFLLINGVKVGKYTWAMAANSREQMQNDFMNNEYKVIVATNAFWMWIDKKDIRFVIHYNLPWSIENYYQEVWRAGRDGKNSFWIVLASYQDTKIQEFFIENSHPSKKDILEVYDYLHTVAHNNIVLKTYYDIASGSGINNDMKVGSIIKILEKYGVLKRGVDDMWDAEFRWRGLTLVQEKRQHSHVMIDWKHQSKLEDEAYFKLDQIKKMLFYPHCRRKFILEYFGDAEDLDKIPDNCATCDFCIDSKKFASWEIVDLVPLSVFGIVLDTIKEFDEKFGIVMIARILTGSNDKRILELNLDESDFYWALEDYKRWLVKAVIESLMEHKFVKKSEGPYPVISVTSLWESSIYKDSLISEQNRVLQQFIHMKYKKNPLSNSLPSRRENNAKKPKAWPTQLETLSLLQSWNTIAETADIKWVKPATIESHIITLYTTSQLSLPELMKTVEFPKIKHIKTLLDTQFPNGADTLSEIKKASEDSGTSVERFDIHVAKAMMEKGDL